MKFFLMENPQIADQLRGISPRWASFSAVGTWDDADFCSACGRMRGGVKQPFLVEWDIAQKDVGDFSWSGYSALVTDRVREYILANGVECKFSSPQIVKTLGDVYNPEIVEVHFQGPVVHWLRPTDEISLDVSATRVDGIACRSCGRTRYRFRRDGLRMKADHWGGRQMFRFKEFSPSDATFVSEAAVEHLSAQQFSNLGFHEAGQII